MGKKENRSVLAPQPAKQERFSYLLFFADGSRYPKERPEKTGPRLLERKISLGKTRLARVQLPDDR
ncbi:MAG: hypothetical protein CW346_12890 [Bacillaceae bacterium]|nr:hypothetical protein [Bacillaceae bacterium]